MKKKGLTGLSTLVLVVTGLTCNYTAGFSNASSIDNTGKKNSIIQSECYKGTINAIKKWEMPQELTEISGISWVDKDRTAAIQDNDGIIFIYNLRSEKIEKRIKFGGPGDYEGIAYARDKYYVMRSDGYMYEINADGDIIKEYDLPLTSQDNIESFCHDSYNNRLLIGQKDGSKGSATKGIYSFELASGQFISKPVYILDAADEAFDCTLGKQSTKGKKNKKTAIRPSEIAIHPASKEIFIADGPNQRILVLSPAGKPQYFLKLDKKSFPQVEGMMFSPQGELYVSTEGVKSPANITKTSIVMN